MSKQQMPKDDGSVQDVVNQPVQAPDPERAQVNRPQIPEEATNQNRWRWLYRSRRGLGLLAGVMVVIVVGVLYSIPVTRYATMGLLVKKSTTVVVVDSGTGKPVTQASIRIGQVIVTTDSQGKASASNVPVGIYQVKISKRYYRTETVQAEVPVFGDMQAVHIGLHATGRQVPVTVINTITKRPVAKALITAGDTSAITDNKGAAIIVLPANKVSVSATLSSNGYNTQNVTVTVVQQPDVKNNFTITPAGKLYFLSKRTGTIDVMKSSLDGSNTAVVLKGTGNEDESDTVLLASRDWRYIGLKAKRDTDNATLYLFDTNNDKQTVIDKGNATFTPVGWYDHYFIYTVNRLQVAWNVKAEALKSFNADTGTITVLDEAKIFGSDSSSAAYEHYTGESIVDGGIVFSKRINPSNVSYDGADITINMVKPSGGDVKVLKTLDRQGYADSHVYKPQEIYFRYTPYYSDEQYFEYDDGKVTQNNTLTAEQYNRNYPTYLLSPSGQKTLWYEERDGKNYLFTGDANGEHEQVLGQFDDVYTPYGWYGDDYVLVSKNGSELFIAPATGLQAANLQKVTDYHRPVYSYYGYGYGYGGL